MTQKMVCITIKGDATTSFSSEAVKSALSSFLIISSVEISSIGTEGSDDLV